VIFNNSKRSVKICPLCSNFRELPFLPAQCICVFCMPLKETEIIFLNPTVNFCNADSEEWAEVFFRLRLEIKFIKMNPFFDVILTGHLR